MYRFDIECGGLNGRFPIPFNTDENGNMIPLTGDPVICIAARLTQEGRPKEQRVIGDIIFTWGKCNKTKLANIMCYYKNKGKGWPKLPPELFANPEKRVGMVRAANGDLIMWDYEDEALMLQQFRDFIVLHAKPQVLSGYNICGFDLPYLMERSKSLGLGAKFDIIGVSRKERTKVKERVFSSKAYGNRKVKEFNISGRLMLDGLAVVLRDFKLRSYTLNAVAEEFFKDKKTGEATERKSDVPHNLIDPLWRGDNETRRRIAEYCWKDVDIADKIEEKLVMFIDKMELARATGVPFSYIITRGQQIRVLSLIMREAKLERRIIPTRQHEEVVEQERYKGATVIDPKPGFYDECIAVCFSLFCFFGVVCCNGVT